MIKSSRLLGAVCASVFSFAAVPSHAALVDNGGGLIYDDVLDITWAQPHGPALGINWNDANTYAAGLTLGGVSDWRLPLASVLAGPGGVVDPSPVDCSSASEIDCRDNELGYMFYYNLGGTLGTPIDESGNTNRDLFSNLLPDDLINFYWSGNRYVIGLPQAAWTFDFGGAGSAGGQGTDFVTFDRWAWAVHDGNVSAVPVPAAVWLFGSGLLGLVGMARRKKAA